MPLYTPLFFGHTLLVQVLQVSRFTLPYRESHENYCVCGHQAPQGRRTTAKVSLRCIRVSVDTLYRDGANDVSRERIQTAPLADPGRAS